MSLIKCKECGKEISNKAESCPNCGVKLPKKTSIVTWALLVSIAIYFVVNLLFPTNESVYSSAPKAKNFNFTSMEICLINIKKLSDSKNLKIFTDKPEEVSGTLDNGNSFSCKKMSTGTKGVYYHGWYEIN